MMLMLMKCKCKYGSPTPRVLHGCAKKREEKKRDI
jgi:hypothetical protein